MNKSEMIDEIAERSNLTKKDIDTVLNLEHDVIKETVAKGESVGYVGFGTFEARPQAAKTMKLKGVAYDVPAKMAPKFNSGKEFKEMVAKSEYKEK